MRLPKLIYSKYFIFLVLLVFVSVALLFPEVANARPGGGHSYSGGSSGGGSGGSGGGGAVLFEMLFRLFFFLPPFLQIALILSIIVAVIWYHLKHQGGGNQVENYVQSSGMDAYRFQQNQMANQAKQQKIDALILRDPDFSEVLFLDFSHSLYHKFYTSINTPSIRSIMPFVSDNIKLLMRSDMTKTSPRTEVVVANMQISDIITSSEQNKIIVDFQSNYSTLQNGKNYRHILKERWVLVRNISTLSAAPEGLRDLACPNCGAPNDFNDAGVCKSCNTLVEAGEMNWMLDKIVIQEHQHYRADTLGTYAPEVGNNAPTIIDPYLKEKGAQFIALHKLEDPAAYWDVFMENIVETTFLSMYKAWSERDNWKSVRHLLSDRLFEANVFWIHLYQEKNYFNRLENITLEHIEPARITIDNNYESITVRVFASAIDYTEDNNGRLIGGNKKSPRHFTEYWTFIRKIGVEKPESEFDATQCPNCGAPADNMSDTSVCGYCGTKTNLGDFSWVLSNIAQDEAYQG
jgi:predicted lipid-binding transport protein (Tim44 family)